MSTLCLFVFCGINIFVILLSDVLSWTVFTFTAKAKELNEETSTFPYGRKIEYLYAVNNKKNVKSVRCED